MTNPLKMTNSSLKMTNPLKFNSNLMTDSLKHDRKLSWQYNGWGGTINDEASGAPARHVHHPPHIGGEGQPAGGVQLGLVTAETQLLVLVVAPPKHIAPVCNGGNSNTNNSNKVSNSNEVIHNNNVWNGGIVLFSFTNKADKKYSSNSSFHSQIKLTKIVLVTLLSIHKYYKLDVETRKDDDASPMSSYRCMSSS